LVPSHRSGAFQPLYSARLINDFNDLAKATSMLFSRVLKELANVSR
jgi:hypothetical protein